MEYVRFSMRPKICGCSGFFGGMGKSPAAERDRKSTRLNSSHLGISYAVFCLKKKKEKLETGGILSGLLSQLWFCLGVLEALLVAALGIVAHELQEERDVISLVFFNDAPTPDIFPFAHLGVLQV